VPPCAGAVNTKRSRKRLTARDLWAAANYSIFLAIRWHR